MKPVYINAYLYLSFPLHDLPGPLSHIKLGGIVSLFLGVVNDPSVLRPQG